MTIFKVRGWNCALVDGKFGQRTLISFEGSKTNPWPF